VSKTKIEHINKAYKRLRISGITVNPSNNQIEDALETLEDMMYTFSSRNICSSYIFEDVLDPNTDSGIDPSFNEATADNLAIRLGSNFGKVIPMELSKLARAGLSNWSARTARIKQIAPPRRQPKGSGNTFRFINWLRFFRIEEGSPISCDTLDLKVDEIDSFSIDFSNYLLDGATIVSVVLLPTNGLQILSDSFNDTVVTMECKGVECGSQTVKITVTTSTGRVNPETVYFSITEV
jgi:hypothetical protein